MLRDVDPLVSICNFHYAEPSSVYVNYHLGRAIADDETGFKGNEPTPYRREAWCFMLAGGAIFSHLDYSFVAGKEDGTHVVDDTTPGIGGPAWRAQLRALKGFLSGFDLRRMQPHTELHPHAHGGVTHVLADVGRAYAVYLEKMPPNMDLKLMMPRGAYSADWIEPATGRVLSHDSFRHSGGVRKLPLPAFDEDCALKIISD
jgi:hypothetical protein